MEAAPPIRRDGEEYSVQQQSMIKNAALLTAQKKIKRKSPLQVQRAFLIIKKVLEISNRHFCSPVFCTACCCFIISYWFRFTITGRF